MGERAFELNLDGLVGPTHNYAGLSYGNLASTRHRQTVSNPRAAALEGLEKMKVLADLGLKQAVCPPPRTTGCGDAEATGVYGNRYGGACAGGSRSPTDFGVLL